MDPDREVLLGAEQEWTVLLQLYGFTGVTPKVVARLSAQGKCLSLYRSVNADMTFVYAESGAEKRRFDPLLWPDEQWGEPLPDELGLTFGDPDRDPYEQAVVLVERITGLLYITDEWLFDTLRTVYPEPSAAGPYLALHCHEQVAFALPH